MASSNLLGILYIIQANQIVRYCKRLTIFYFTRQWTIDQMMYKTYFYVFTILYKKKWYPTTTCNLILENKLK